MLKNFKFTNPLKDKPYRMWHRIAYYFLCLGCLLISLTLIVASISGENSPAATWLGYGAIAGVVLFYGINMVKWRCPECHRPLPLLGPVIECRYCKHRFMDDKGNQTW